MDLPDVAPGPIIYLPVNAPGACSISATATRRRATASSAASPSSIPATVELQVDLIKGWTITWPRLENENVIMTIGTARPMEDAARIAYRELVRWMAPEFGFDELEAYMLLTQAGRVRLGNMVDPKYTIGTGIAKKLIGL